MRDEEAELESAIVPAKLAHINGSGLAEPIPLGDMTQVSKASRSIADSYS
jgi:hypothetical protein